ncbi:MAG: hypothetical protein IQL11_03980 [Bacteroidales bacterium]|nr:hypothetical protein [Bacteroidales bacterium]
MKSLSVIILMAFLITLPSCKFFRNRGLFNKKERTLAMLKAQQDSIRVADSLKRVQDRLMAIENARLDSIRLAEEEKLTLASRYNIIVGSFITPEYARAWAEEYRKLGYDTKILKLEGTNFEMVSAESHESFRRAVARLEQFRDTVQIDTWLYIKK